MKRHRKLNKLTQDCKNWGQEARPADKARPVDKARPEGKARLEGLTSLTDRTKLALAGGFVLIALAAGPGQAQSGGATNPSQAASAKSEVKPGQVLDPNNYVGMVRAGYQAAKEIPDICAKLFCYCGCDLTDCHGSLLDCFTSDHGVDCHICQEESILALKFHRKGKSLSYIQKYIDKRYAKEYPFEIESPILEKYKADRLWDIGKKGADSKKKKSTEASSTTPVAKAGKRRKDGSCCEGDKDKKQ
jgi:hypothetical protein